MKLKQLAAAAALVCTAPAFAGIEVIGGAGELFGIVWDENVATYAIDFGVTIDQLFAAPGSFTLATLGGANWDSYTAADTDRSDFTQYEGGTRWAVFAVDEEGFNFIDGDLQWLGTSTGDITPMLQNIDLDLINGATGTGGMAGYFNNNGMGVVVSENTDLFALKGNPGAFVEDKYYAGLGPYAGNPVGGTNALFYCTNKDGFDSTGPANCGQLQTAATMAAGRSGVSIAFDGQSFVAVVPEPGTYALFAAGLMAVGFVARRRA